MAYCSSILHADILSSWWSFSFHWYLGSYQIVRQVARSSPWGMCTDLSFAPPTHTHPPYPPLLIISCTYNTRSVVSKVSLYLQSPEWRSVHTNYLPLWYLTCMLTHIYWLFTSQASGRHQLISQCENLVSVAVAKAGITVITHRHSY